MNGDKFPCHGVPFDDGILHHNHPIVRGLISLLMGTNVTQLRISLTGGARFCPGLASEIKRYFTKTNNSGNHEIQFFIKRSYAGKHAVEDMTLCEREPSGMYLEQVGLMLFVSGLWNFDDPQDEDEDEDSDCSEQSDDVEVGDEGVNGDEAGRDEEGQSEAGQEGADNAGTTNGTGCLRDDDSPEKKVMP